MKTRLLLFLFVLNGCASSGVEVRHQPDSGATKIPLASGSNYWVSSSLKRVTDGVDGIHAFVKEKYSWVPEYFVIINISPASNKAEMFNPMVSNWEVLASGTELIGTKSFRHEVKPYGLVRMPGGKYQDIINETPYSFPKCGLIKQYEEIDGPVTIDVVSVASCGNFLLEYKNEKYRSEFIKRAKSLLSFSKSSFGVD